MTEKEMQHWIATYKYVFGLEDNVQKFADFINTNIPTNISQLELSTWIKDKAMNFDIVTGEFAEEIENNDKDNG